MAPSGKRRESELQSEPGYLRRRQVLYLGPKAQIVCVVAAFLLSAWLTISSVSYFGSRNLLTDKADYIRDLEQAYAELLSQSHVSTAAFVQRVEELEHTSGRQRLAVDELARIQEALQRQLESRERQLGVLTRQRNEAQGRARHLARVSTEIAQQLAELQQERSFLSEQLDTVQARLAEASHQRDSGRRIENGLRWQVARLESRLLDLEQNREAAHMWFKDYVVSSVEALEHLFDGTGVDLETLVARAAGDEVAQDATAFQGGPFQDLDAETQPASVTLARTTASDAITDHIRRLSALQKLASALPLASPLDHFHVTGYYGKRRDPLTSRLAFHGGIDLGAAAGSEALATAPGQVSFAGFLGPYGYMVEIEHGMGVTTRYAHLKEITVEAGTNVEFRQPVGVIGNTGRSTGRHLHYEVRVDGEPQNPARFLEAGRYLVDIFNLKPAATAEGPSPQG